MADVDISTLGAKIKIAYEDESDTNALTDALLAEIAANTAKVANATHTGDVTGSVGLTIADDAVSYTKIQNVVADERILGRVSGANGVVEELTKAQVLTMLNVEDGANAFERRDIAFTDETSDLTTGDAKATFHMPNYATTLLEVSIGVTTAPTGSTAIFDLEENGTTVLSTLITIDIGDKTSEDAGTPPVISDSVLAANALMTVNIDQIGSSVAGTGAKLYIKYKRA